MSKKIKIERRKHSLVKPLLYLLLQAILIWEIFWVLTGEASFSAWSVANLIISSGLILYLFKKTVKIMQRTPESDKWTDIVKADKFLD